MSSFSRQQLEEWLKTIEVKGGKVLDVGGSQNPLSSKRLKTFEPEKYDILDLEVPHQCKQVPDLPEDIQKMTWEDYNRDWQKYYDIAFCLEVSEYWWNPFQALKNINTFLKKDGLLYLSTHFIYPVHNPVKEDYLRYTRQGIIKLLTEAGFYEISAGARICKLESPEGNLNTNILFSKEGMRPAKEYAKHFEVGNLITARKK